MKVLLFCPTARLEQETVDAILRLDVSGHAVDVLMTRHNPTHRGSVNILLNYQRGRQTAIAGGYDAMLCIESDMIPPADALQRLAAIDADIACGLYVHRHYTTEAHPFWNPQVWDENTTEPGPWLNWFPELRQAAWGNVVRVSAGGMGCVLIHRRVLDAFDFRLVFFPNRQLISDCDTWFYHDAIKAGFVTKCDLGLICGHKQKNGVILWPELHGHMRQSMTHYPPSPYTLKEVSQHGTTHA